MVDTWNDVDQSDVNDAVGLAKNIQQPVTAPDLSNLPGATLSAYKPSWKDQIANWMLGSEKPTPEREQFVQGLMGSRGMGSTGPSVSDFTPMGQILNAQESAREGDLRGAAMAILPMGGAEENIAVQLAKRQLSPVGLYSHGAEAAMAIPQAKGAAEQMVGMLRKQPGVSENELINAGILTPEGQLHPDFSSRGTISREDLSSHLQSSMPQVEETVLRRPSNPYFYRDADEWMDAIQSAERRGDWDEASELTHAWESLEGYGSSGTPKYEKYTLPGGENYREVLLKLNDPANQRKSEIENIQQLRDVTPEEAAEHKSLLGSAIDYRSPHWDEPNVLAHIRMADRTGPNGEKILHVEEVQSDWGQKGKKEGFRNDSSSQEIADLRRKLASMRGDEPEYRSIFARFQDLKNKTVEDATVPHAPYVTSTQGWTDLALKRILKEAAEGGYDKVVWTPGVEQAGRYDLSKQISKLEYDPQDKTLNYTTNEGVFVRYPNYVEPNELPNVIGKEATEKLLAQEKHKITGRQTLSTSDLQIGGEGMKEYYDKILPNRLQTVAKKHDKNAKLGYSQVSGTGRYEVVLPNGKVIADYPDKSSADIIAKKQQGATVRTNNLSLPGLDITPQMRESILKGQGAFKRGGSVSTPMVDHALRLAHEYDQ